MMVFAPLVIQAVYGAKFLDAAPMVVASLVILSCAVVIFGGGMHITSLVAVGKERWVFTNRLCWGVVNLVINYFLITYYGGIGAMIGTQLCNTCACIAEGWYAKRIIGPAMSAQRVLPILLISAVSVALAFGVLAFVPVSVPALVRVAIAGLVTLAFCVAGYIAFKIPDARRVLEKARSILIKKSTSAGVPTTAS
jgi:O-antigen/teichoic acid export membrane protein